MSMESARLLVETLKTDSELLKRLDNAATADGKEAIIYEAGFECTEEELSEAQSELDDDALDNVSGGSRPKYMSGASDTSHI